MDKDLIKLIDNNGKIGNEDVEDFLRLAQLINIASKLIKDEVLEKIAIFTSEEEFEELQLLLYEAQEDIEDIDRAIEIQELKEESYNRGQNVIGETMTLDEKFELYLEVGFIKFLEILHENNELSYDSLEEYSSKMYPEDDNFNNEEYIREAKLQILDELEMYEDLFMDYQKRMGNL